MPEEHEPQPVRTELWVAVGSVAAARAAQAAGAAQVWLDGIDCWQAAPPALDDLPPGCWLRQPPTVATSPHLAAIGLPVVAGHVGTIRAARAAGLPVQADQHLNCFGIHCLAALAELGVAAAVISYECSCREVAKVVRRRRPGLPRLGLTVHGRLPAMLTRQQHGVAPGDSRRLQAVPRDGGLPYELERRPGGQTVLWEARRLMAPEPVQRTAGLVEGWVLELADCTAVEVGLVTAAYRRLSAGAISPADLPQALAEAAPRASFAGHLHRGSRALDDVRDEMQAV